MAIKWYLMKEEEIASNPTDEEKAVFTELLETGIGVDVEIYRYDLELIAQTKAIVKNKVADTLLQSIKLQMSIPCGIAVAGNYVKYKNRYWLIVGLVDDNNGVYDKLVLRVCNYPLTWINNRGKVVQRWAVAESAAQYNNGESNMQVGMLRYYVRSDQMLIFMPDDDESVLINDGQRFIIDRKTKIYEKQMKQGIDLRSDIILDVYQCTRDDSVYYDFTDLDGKSSGVMQFMAYQDEQQPTDGYYEIGGKGYWICGKPSVADNSESTFRIKHVSDQIYVGMGYVTFDADVDDDVNVLWSITGDAEQYLDVINDGNTISIKTDNVSAINKTFILSMSADGYDDAQLRISIKAFV